MRETNVGAKMNPIELPREFPPEGLPFRYVFKKIGPNQFAPRLLEGVLNWGKVKLFKEETVLPPADFDLQPFLFGDYLFAEYSNGRFNPLPDTAAFSLGKGDKGAREEVMHYKTEQPPLLGRRLNWLVIPVYFENQTGTPFKVWSIFINSIPLPHVHPTLFDQLHGTLETTGVFEGSVSINLPVGIVKMSLREGWPPEPTRVIVYDQFLDHYGFQVTVPWYPIDEGTTEDESERKYVRSYTEIPPAEQFPIPRSQIGRAFIGMHRWKEIPMIIEPGDEKFP